MKALYLSLIGKRSIFLEKEAGDSDDETTEADAAVTNKKPVFFKKFMNMRKAF